MLILRPRASRMAPSDAEAMPLPSEETTPPVTKTNRFMMSHRRFKNVCVRRNFKRRAKRSHKEWEFDGSSDYQNAPASTIQIAARAFMSPGLLCHPGRIVPRDAKPGCIRFCAPTCVHPQIGDGDQIAAGKHK